jgi:hypothetical protein
MIHVNRNDESQIIHVTEISLELVIDMSCFLDSDYRLSSLSSCGLDGGTNFSRFGKSLVF